MTILVTAESVVLVLLVVLVAGLLRSHADILRALHQLGVGDTGAGDPVAVRGPSSRRPAPAEGVPPGRPAPDLIGVTPAGEAASVGLAGAGTDTLVAFLSSGCGTCAGFWSDLGRGAQADLGGLRVVIVTRDPAEESVSALARLAPPGLTVLMSNAAWDDFAVPGSPYFVYVDAGTGTVAGEGTASRWDQLVSLCRQADADSGGAGTPGGPPAGRQGTRWNRWLNDAEREERADRELMAAGIHPGHASLYPPTREDGEGDSAR